MSGHPANRRRSSGQAASEYIVVLGFTALALVALGLETNVIDDILTAVKNFFKAFSYALSIPAQDDFP